MMDKASPLKKVWNFEGEPPKITPLQKGEKIFKKNFYGKCPPEKFKPLK